MKATPVLAAALLGAAATAASAQVYYSRTNDPYLDRSVYLDSRHECWNPGARTFEQVRPGDHQPDLDFRYCRLIGVAAPPPVVRERVWGEPYSGWRNSEQECWNPRVRGWEAVRPGEYQNDLDYNNCRYVSVDRFGYRWR